MSLSVVSTRTPMIIGLLYAGGGGGSMSRITTDRGWPDKYLSNRGSGLMTGYVVNYQGRISSARMRYYDYEGCLFE